jgi:glutamate/aspartate transport system substrate-binding protein
VKFRSGFRVLVLLAGLLAPGAALMAQGTLDRIAERGEFRIGYRTDARPLSFEEDGRPAGYSVDLCRRIADAVRAHLRLTELAVSYVPVTLANRFSAVVNGDIDIECGSTTITLGRSEQVDFTLMTFVTGGSLLSMADDPIPSTDALAGKRVAVIGATSTEAGLESYLAENGIDASVVRVASSDEGMSGLVDGSVDAFASDQIVLVGDALNAMEADPDLNFFFSPELFSYEPYAFMVRRDDAAFRLVANRAIAGIFRSGDFGELYETWIGSFGIDPSPLLLAMYQVQALSE